VLPLLLLHIRFDVLADPLSHAQLRESILLELERECQPLDDAERFEQLQLLIEREIRRVAGGVRKRTGGVDGPHERGDPAIIASQLENFFHHRTVFALELTRSVGGRRRVGPLVDLEAQDAVGAGLRGAGNGAVQRDERQGAVLLEGGAVP
jgi:hypothetical protein